MHASSSKMSSSPAKSSSVAPSSSHVKSSSITPSSAMASTHMMSSSAHPTTTPKPTTPKPTTPSPDVMFAYKEGNNTCFLLKGDIKIMLNYENVANESVAATMHLDKKCKVTGSCSELKKNDSASFLELSCDGGLTFTMKFHGGNKWYLKQLIVDIDNTKKHFNSSITKFSASHMFNMTSINGELYQASTNSSYQCDTEEKFPLINTNSKVTSYNITVDMKHIQIQPFIVNDGKFKTPVKCPASNTPDNGSNSIVPIAVGCALAGLIVIVLIAYLIGRRKGNNRGYQQV